MITSDGNSPWAGLQDITKGKPLALCKTGIFAAPGRDHTQRRANARYTKGARPARIAYNWRGVNFWGSWYEIAPCFSLTSLGIPLPMTTADSGKEL